MEWSDFLRGELGWGALAVSVAGFLRSLMNGDLVLRREYESLKETAREAIEKADAAVERANANATKTIEAQAEVIESYKRDRGKGGV